METSRLKLFILSVVLLVISPLILTVLYCSDAFAQTDQPADLPASLTLSSAIRIALEKNPTVKAAFFQVEEAAAKTTQAGSGFFPQVYISEAFQNTNNPMWAFGTRLNQKVIRPEDFNPDKLNNPDAINNFATAISMDWPLLDPVRTWYPSQQSKENLSAAEHALNRTRQTVIARTVSAYTGVLLAMEHLDVVHQSLKTAQAHLKMVEDRYESGFIVKSDLLRIQVRIGELEQNLIESESNLEIARANLSATLGLPVDHRFEIVGLFNNGPDHMVPEIQGPVEKWIEMALSHRPDLEAFRFQQKMAEKEIKKSQSAHWPSIHLMGNYEWNSENFNDMADNYTVGAVARLNLFSGNRYSAGTKEAKAALARVKETRKAMEDGIRVETRRAFFQTQSAWKRISVAKTATMQAEEGLRIVRNRYESGLITIVDLLDAQITHENARMNYASALHDYKTATAQLALASGTIDVDFK